MPTRSLAVLSLVLLACAVRRVHSPRRDRAPEVVALQVVVHRVGRVAGADQRARCRRAAGRARA